jgi:hypothetical protein
MNGLFHRATPAVMTQDRWRMGLPGCLPPRRGVGGRDCRQQHHQRGQGKPYPRMLLLLNPVMVNGSPLSLCRRILAFIPVVFDARIDTFIVRT